MEMQEFKNMPYERPDMDALKTVRTPFFRNSQDAARFRFRQDDVAPAGKGSVGEALECAASHDDGVAGGEGLEALEVVGEPV